MADFGKYLKNALDTDVRPGDENTPANSLRNALIDKLGLPEQYMESTADQKQAYKDLPASMGMGAMGTVRGIGTQAEQALSKLVAAKQAGQKLSAAEELLLSKVTGRVPVVKTAQEAAEQRFGNIKKLVGE